MTLSTLLLSFDQPCGSSEELNSVLFRFVTYPVEGLPHSLNRRGGGVPACELFCKAFLQVPVGCQEFFDFVTAEEGRFAGEGGKYL